MATIQTTRKANQSRERLFRQAATLAALAIPRPVYGDALERHYAAMGAEELERIVEAWRSVLRDSFAARLKGRSDESD